MRDVRGNVLQHVGRGLRNTRAVQGVLGSVVGRSRFGADSLSYVRSTMRTPAQLTKFLVIVTAAVWLAACGGSNGSGATEQPAGSPTTYALTVNVAGSGTVSSSPAGLACTNSCSGSFDQGSNVVLTAAPSTGYSFSGWSGACSGSGTCTVAMNSANTVTATFAQDSSSPGSATYSVSVAVSGGGTVSSVPGGINCGSVCSASFQSGSTVSLVAVAGAGQQFAGWSGDCSGTAGCSVAVSGARSVVALFTPTASGQFAARPYLFKADEVRLRAMISAGDPEATGTSSNNIGQPIGFLSLAQAAHANRGDYADVPTWHIALAGWLLNNTAMLQRARDEALAIVATAPSGDSGTGDVFQHVEDRILNVAAVADLAYGQFSATQLTQVANFVNGTLSNWDRQNVAFWPNDEPFNNYWQNGFLAHVVGGIATQGFNPQAATWRAGAESMASKFVNRATVGWSGPVQSEGHYYAGYVNHAFWAMELYDAALGTSYLAQSKFSPGAQLDLLMYQTRPHLLNFFEVGSEANDSAAPHTFLSVLYWHHLISSGRSTAQAQQAKAILSYAMSNTLTPRWAKAFANFYWSIRSVPTVTLSAKADRLYAAPTPGAGLIGVRSSAGFQTNARAALMFATHFGGGAAYSHANPDAPGFQWGDGADWLVTDPEYFNNSGIMAEAGSANLSDVSNIVTLDGHKQNPKGIQPRIVRAEDNRAAAPPHFYVQIDAQAYWNMTSTYRRDYVWLDDLRVVLVWDRIVGPPAKRWRLHIPSEPQVGGASLRYDVGSTSVVITDLLAPDSRPWQVERVLGVWRVSQSDPSSNYRSLKLLDLGGRVQVASVSRGSGWYEAALALDGRKLLVRFFEDGGHATVGQSQ